MYKRLLSALVASLAFLSLASANEAREPQRSESELELLSTGEFSPYIDEHIRWQIYAKGREVAETGDNEDWQVYCTYWYGEIMYLPELNGTTELAAAYATCNDIASHDKQTKENWISRYFAE